MYQCSGVGRFHFCFDQKDEKEMLGKKKKKAALVSSTNTLRSNPKNSPKDLDYSGREIPKSPLNTKFQPETHLGSINYTFVRKEKNLQAKSSRHALNTPASDNTKSNTKLSTYGH